MIRRILISLAAVGALVMVGSFGLVAMFGFMTSGDRAALSCERRWNSYEDFLRQGNPVAAHGVALSFGISDRLDLSSPADKERFMESCVPIRTRELRRRGSD